MKIRDIELTKLARYIFLILESPDTSLTLQLTGVSLLQSLLRLCFSSSIGFDISFAFLGYCDYKGVHYTKGQTWDDGCKYTCQCIDDGSGQWQCDEK